MSRRTGADPLGPACGPPTIDAIIEFWSLEVSKVLKMPTRRAVRGNAAMHLEAFLSENCREQWRGFTRMEMVLSRCLVWRGRLSRRPPHFSPPAAAAVSPALDEHTRQQPAATSSTSFEPVGRSAHGEARRRGGETARGRRTATGLLGLILFIGRNRLPGAAAERTAACARAQCIKRAGRRCLS